MTGPKRVSDEGEQQQGEDILYGVHKTHESLLAAIDLVSFYETALTKDPDVKGLVLQAQSGAKAVEQVLTACNERLGRSTEENPFALQPHEMALVAAAGMTATLIDRICGEWQTEELLFDRPQ
jgi:hypothetical protein